MMLFWLNRMGCTEDETLHLFLVSFQPGEDVAIDSYPIPSGTLGQPAPWRKGKLLGRGAFGAVWLGMTLDGQLVAVKQVDMDNASSRKSNFDTFERESSLLQNLNHEHVVRYIGGLRVQSANLALIFLEYVPGGSISSILQAFGPLDEDVVSAYTRQILLGLEYLHSNDVMHRDLKPANILVDPSGNVKISDFGCSKLLGSPSNGKNTLVGTPNYMAPEVLKSKTGTYTFVADIWSLGMTVSEMCTGETPFSDYSNQHALMFALARQQVTMPTLPSAMTSSATSFLDRCFLSADTRPTSTQLLSHKFVAPRASNSPVRQPNAIAQSAHRSPMSTPRRPCCSANRPRTPPTLPRAQTSRFGLGG
mmetsp:Transcript_74357/g.174531  ORF Transcript_74357/g.174531 Transcript_74357/m.174531 type:complete len:363 (-) Transcript_74357:62-1150(-)